MILDEYVNVVGHSKNLKYYKDLGYEVECRKSTPIKSVDLTSGSTFIIRCACDSCGSEKKMQFREYYSYTSGLTSNYYCKKCSVIKQKETLISNWGVDNPMKSDVVKNKLKDSILKKWGVDHYSKTQEYKDRYKKTCLDKYGVDNASKFEETKKLISDIKFKEHNLISKIPTLIPEDYSVLEYSTDRFFTINHHACGQDFRIFVGTINDRIRGRNIICTNCNPIDVAVSSGEIEIKNFLVQNGVDFISNSYSIISPLSLDIYIPEKKLAIEFNGIYWHSEVFKDKNYHRNKTKMCEDRGIRLIHIWEDDWRDRSEIVKSMILSQLSISNRIFARNCEIREVDNIKVVKEFLNSNHIQGYSNSTYKIGLYYENQLVSLMTFSKKRKEMELVRFCSKIGFSVIGAASRMFKYFITKFDPNEVISYSDSSSFSGGMYEKIGFELDGATPPNYWWVVNLKRAHRFNFRKSRLKKLFGDVEGSEKEIMQKMGYYRIWGSGMKRWRYKK
jgi:G:T-mismatch repair DNA endonuclease (very short patch repair protein)